MGPFQKFMAQLGLELLEKNHLSQKLHGIFLCHMSFQLSQILHAG